MNANNQAERDWRIFRKYKFPRITIVEKEDHIQFRQWSGASLDNVAKLAITIGVLWMGPVIIMMFTSMWQGAPVIFFLGIPVAMAAFGIGWALLQRKTYVDVYPESIAVKNATQDVKVPYDQIRNIDVRQNGFWHTVMVWHGPVGLYTLWDSDPDHALMLKEGMVAAIGMVRSRVGAGAQAPRRTFAE
jgi:hypothetical protein